MRVREVANALFSIFDERGIRKGQLISIATLEVAMDAKGYPGNLTHRAIELLHDKGAIDFRDSYLVVLGDNPVSPGSPKKRRDSRRQPRRQTNL